MIAAALWRDVLTGVLIERAACVIAVLATGAYALGAIQVLGGDVFTLPVLVTILYGPAALSGSCRSRRTFAAPTDYSRHAGARRRGDLWPAG
jgi:hypothetical protein